MAYKTDMAKAKKKHEEEKARAAAQQSFGRRTTWWKAKPGSNKIRLLPPWTGEGPNKGQFWREVWIHYGVTNMEAPDEDNTFSVPCPRRSPDGKYVVGDGEKPDCQVCQLAEELRTSGNPADLELSKQLRAKMRVYTNIIDQSDPVWTSDAVDELKANGCPDEHLPEEGDPKVQVYNFGPNIFKMILDQYSDDVDLADLSEGHDIIIEREGTDIKTKYRVRAQIKSTAAPIKDEQLDDSMWNLDNLVPYFTEEQTQLILDGGTKEEVYQLTSATVSEDKQLPESTESKEEEKEEPAAAETVEDSDPSVLDHSSIPVDDDGDINFDALTDEQIENPANAEAKVTNNEGTEYAAHISCFGKEDERTDECVKECGLADRCVKRIEAKQQAAEEAKKAAAAAKKKGAPGKKKKKGAPAGKGNGAKAKAKPKAGKATSTPPATDADDLEAQMLAAMGKNK